MQKKTYLALPNSLLPRLSPNEMPKKKNNKPKIVVDVPEFCLQFPKFRRFYDRLENKLTNSAIL